MQALPRSRGGRVGVILPIDLDGSGSLFLQSERKQASNNDDRAVQL